MIMDFIDFILDQSVQCQAKGNQVFSPPHGGAIFGLNIFKKTCIYSVL